MMSKVCQVQKVQTTSTFPISFQDSTTIRESGKSVKNEYVYSKQCLGTINA